MGIVNVTPDSFSDGGRYLDAGAAVAHGERLAAEGAGVLDVGGESTRPGAAAVDPAEERARVVPVVRGLAARGWVVSVDTRRAEVAEAALDAGAAWVNDVSGGEDPAMAALVARRGARWVLMHMRGSPATMQSQTRYDDVVAEVWGELAWRRARALDAGVAPEALLLDPGIGFAKDLAGNLALLRSLPEACARGPVLLGASRKSFIGALTGEPDPGRRLEGSLAVALWAAQAGVAVLRVHDVAATARALAVWAAVRGAAVQGAAAPVAGGAP